MVSLGKCAWKYNIISFLLLHDYFNSFNFYRNGELPIVRSGVQVKKENENFTVVCSRSPQNLECGNFSRCFLAQDGKEMYQI